MLKSISPLKIFYSFKPYYLSEFFYYQTFHMHNFYEKLYSNVSKEFDYLHIQLNRIFNSHNSIY